VWFSSIWQEKTPTAFQRALMTVIEAETQLSSRVLSYLSYWSIHNTVNKSTAYSLWLESQTETQLFVANFTRIVDRVAASRYITTGELLGGTTGSVVMFSNPPGSGAISLNSNILASIRGTLLWKEWKKSTVNDIVQAGLNLLIERIEKFSRLAQSGALQIKIHYKIVDLKYPEVVREISASNPYTMNWSNVCDYFHPQIFSRLAKACSGSEDTVHCMYSMNWSTSCYGSHIFDIRQEMRQVFIDGGNELVKTSYQLEGLEGLLVHPPITNAVNTASLPLYFAQMPNWCNQFFSFGSFQKSSQWKYFPESPNLFSRTMTTFYMLFTFDEKISFQGV
jgi:hypothetical protein